MERGHNYPGFFITVEGVDDTGKTTLVKAITKLTKGLWTQLREPGGTPRGEIIRGLLAGQILTYDSFDRPDLTDSLLFFAARAELIEKAIIPKLKRGQTVICDRFADSGTAYYKGIPSKALFNALSRAVASIKPDITILLEPEKRPSDSLGIVYDRYRKIAAEEPDRFIIIPSFSLEPKKILEMLYERISKTFQYGGTDEDI